MDSGAEQPEVGRVVDGKYRLTRLLGRGGMGSVWEGVHTTLGTRFALKYIDAAFAGRKDVQLRFANEALAAARLKSKHIVEVYDHGVDERGCPYIVMEFLSGEPLDRRLARDGQLSVGDTAVLVLQIARALSRAHAAGIVHRDLKPENVFLVWDEEDQRTVVKIVDFGIAKFTDGTGVDTATRTGAVLGTPHYMSPEQARGLKSVDFAADVWSLGVIAYRCVAGRAPFEGEAVGDLLVKICTAPHVPPSQFVNVPQGFDEWVARSLAKEPRDRFESMAAQAEALAAVAGESDLAAASSGAALGGPPPVAPAVTAPTVQTPPAHHSSSGRQADTQGGIERSRRSGRAPSGRRWWLLGLPAAGLLAGAWLALRTAPEAPSLALSADGPGSALGSTLAAASSAAPLQSAPMPEERSSAPPAAEPRPSARPDAGAPSTTVTLGRPADSRAEQRKRRTRSSPARQSGSPEQPARTPRPAPQDELGY